MIYLVLGVVAGLAAVERKGFLQAMLSRPIALGPLTGLALGDASAGLVVAAPLELLWLGAVNLGASLPVHEALGTAAITGGTVLGARLLRASGLSGPWLLPASAILALMVCSPLALVGRRAEHLVERFNERLYARAERDLAQGEIRSAARVNLYGLALPFGISFVLAPLGAAVTVLAADLVGLAPKCVPFLAVGWAAFSALACASGARAMRSTRAQSVYFGALIFGLFLFAAVALAGGRA